MNGSSASSLSRRIPVVIRAGCYLTGAHHPHCARYEHHLLWIAGRPLCLGCTCACIGLVVGISTFLVVPWQRVSVVQWIGWHLLTLVPTVLQPWARVKWFKIVARALLGMTVSSYWLSGLFVVRSPLHSSLWFALLIAAFVGGYRALRALRNAHADDPCRACPEGVFPTCTWNLPRLLADPAFSDGAGILQEMSSPRNHSAAILQPPSRVASDSRPGTALTCRR
jgi:hypothetical protein